MKVGWAGDNFPESIFPTLAGRPMLRYEEQLENVQIKELMLGEEAAKNRVLLELSHPIENGVVKDWDMMLKLWEYGLFEKVKYSAIFLDENKSNKNSRNENPIN